MRPFVVAAGLVLVADLTVVAASGPLPRPLVIAHRGDSGRAPENTLPAYTMALEAGADLVETDVQPTKDGVLVCLHDTSLERTTDVETVFPDRFKVVKEKKVWPLADFTLEEVKRLDAGSWKDARFAGTRIPTFLELIEAVRGRGGILVEIKSPEVYLPLGFDLGELTLADLRKARLDAPDADPKTPIVLQSFGHECLRTLRVTHGSRLPTWALTSLAEEATPEALDAFHAYTEGVALAKKVILERPAVVAEAHARGLSVGAWTFRASKPEGFATVGEEMVHFVKDLGLDAVITDDPGQYPRSAGGARGERAVFPPYVRPTLIAHRGDSGRAPEHTIAAYRLALEAGADFVEPDLQITKDGVLVCLHDTSLERTTDVETVFPDRFKTVKEKKVWPVADFTLEEVKRLDAGSWKDAKYAGERVPTFQEMIDTVRGRAGIIPETKAPETYRALGFDMAGLVMDVLRTNHLDTPGADPKTPVVIQSFSAESIVALREEHGCRLPMIALVSKPEQATPEALAAIGRHAQGVSPSKEVVLDRPSLIEEAHGLGLSVTVWTFREGKTAPYATVREEMRHFVEELGVDAVFTDNPDQFPRR
jgi:glycerophosphoryl diester phosphodiesterase